MKIAHFFPSIFHCTCLYWSRPIAQQIVSYCTHFNKNITEGSIPQIRVGWDGMFWKSGKMYSNSPAARTVISFESPAG